MSTMTCWRSRREIEHFEPTMGAEAGVVDQQMDHGVGAHQPATESVGRGFQGHVSNDQLNLDSIDEVLGQCAQAIARTADHYELHTPAG
jgi:hypothetical protein